MYETVKSCIKKIGETNPLIHNITNYVVMNSTANILLAIGASPVMAHSIDEVEEIASVSSAVILNIGTIQHSWLESMILAGKTANKNRIPVVLDPVGSGATKLRTEAVKRIFDEVKIDIFRGNTSEIMSVISEGVQTKGVDSTLSLNKELQESIKNLAKEKKCVVVASGKEDFITNGKESWLTKNGHPVMTKVTGTGCGLSAVTGAFCSVLTENKLKAGVAASALFSSCGEKAAKISSKPGSFMTAFLDTLYTCDDDDVLKSMNIVQLDTD
ncbi:MAG: hydroxyethylthiazole kinase [Flexistipes sinusarabici]|uniref:Hydroxyethylthiazole kinase n=1 Tax=Flexistipes sinusarabici TaxID=2352 RepID=A0A5D0MQF7_FLESI|nr:hydroxyethylthiazole kinase [Flexistipes sinusarabici]TYB34355.1 MAG: hydroxyethylthiazole kinase [Flexistipes sinusarabici]